MHIDVIDNFSEFNELRSNWDAVYEADPEGHFYLSWQWLSDWLTHFQTVWFVLACKPHQSDAAYVAFLPLRMRTLFDKKQGFYNEFYFAGDAFSDYTGILTRPEFEADAVPALAEYIKRKLNWATLTMENLRISERRRQLFLKQFDKIRFLHKPIEYVDKETNVDHAICPSINCPSTWDEYLSTISANNRQKIRRLLRKVESCDDYRITLSDASTFDQDITTLLQLWKIKWGPLKKGRDIDGMVRRNYTMLTRCAENGTLFLPVFWHGDRPVAALATLIDTCKKAFLFAITGRDESYDEMPAGYLLHAYSIRHAISHGFITYDFLRGNEPYKYLFASQEHRLKAGSVVTKTRRNLGGKLDPRGREAMLKQTLEFERAGEIAEAERCYGQILEMKPDDGLALFRSGRLMARKGDHAEAKRLLSRSVEVEPEGDNTWFWLARSLQALGDHEAALEACRRVVKLQPGNEDAKKLILQLSLSADRATSKLWPAKAVDRACAPAPGFGAADVGPNWGGPYQLAVQGLTLPGLKNRP